ncbi:MAG TPA: PAS domain S-box protein [Terriglobia bacterium]
MSAALASGPRSQFGPVTDYHGPPTLAALRLITDTSWVLNQRIDRNEAFEALRQVVWLQVVAVGLFIEVLGILLGGSRRRRQARALRDRIEHRQDLLEAERYAREIVDSVPSWLLVVTHNLRIQSANQPFLDYFGLRQEEVQGRPLGDIIRTEDLPHPGTAAVNGRATTQDVLLRVTCKLREVRLPARITLVDLVRVMEGKPELLLVVEDLTESEHLRLVNQAKERALRESEDRYRDFLESTEDFVGTHDLSGTILSASLAVARRLGFKNSQDLLGRNIVDFLSPDRRPQFDAYLDALRQEGRAQGLMKALTSNGDELILEYKNSLRREGAEGPVVLCVAREVTDRVRAQAALKQAQQFRESVMESVTNGIAVLDLEGRFTFVNRRAAEITGYSVGGLTGQPYAVLLSPEDGGAFGAALAKASREGVPVSACQTRIVRKDGSH